MAWSELLPVLLTDTSLRGATERSRLPNASATRSVGPEFVLRERVAFAARVLERLALLSGVVLARAREPLGRNRPLGRMSGVTVKPS